MTQKKNKIDKEKGFIVLYRQIEDNWLWLSEPFTKSQAWIDLLLMTNHKDGAFFLRGIKVEVKRGQLARGEENLSSRWKWSKGKVRKFLKLLESEQQIELHRSNKINIIEILNYDSYQKVTNKPTNKKTTERLQTDQQKDPNNKENNDNNDNNVNKEESAFFLKLKNLGVDAETWNGFINTRTLKKKPMTEDALTLVMNKLAKFEEIKIGFAKLSLENAIENSWTTIWEPKSDSTQKQLKTTPASQNDDQRAKLKAFYAEQEQN